VLDQIPSSPRDAAIEGTSQGLRGLRRRHVVTTGVCGWKKAHAKGPRSQSAAAARTEQTGDEYPETGAIRTSRVQLNKNRGIRLDFAPSHRIFHIPSHCCYNAEAKSGSGWGTAHCQSPPPKKNMSIRWLDLKKGGCVALAVEMGMRMPA